VTLTALPPRILGKSRGAVFTHPRRMTSLTLLIGLPGDHSAQSVSDALISTFSKLPVGLRRTPTWDQGNEMFHHQRIEQPAELKIYFADPDSPWQRG
jgi:IS30 family transposase